MFLGLSDGMEILEPATVTPSESPDRTIEYGCVVGTMVAVTIAPSSTHWVPNEQLPAPEAVTAIRFCVFQFQVSSESSVMVNVVFVPVPLEGTLPQPVHPVQTWRMPEFDESATGLFTVQVWVLPEVFTTASPDGDGEP